MKNPYITPDPLKFRPEILTGKMHATFIIIINTMLKEKHGDTVYNKMFTCHKCSCPVDMTSITRSKVASVELRVSSIVTHFLDAR